MTHKVACRNCKWESTELDGIVAARRVAKAIDKDGHRSTIRFDPKSNYQREDDQNE